MDATPGDSGAIGYMTPRAFVDKVDPEPCGTKAADVACSEEGARKFEKSSGHKAAMDFCERLHIDRGGMFLNQLYYFQARSIHTTSGIFDLQATCEQCLKGHNRDFNFAVQKHYEDCKASYDNLVGSCCKSDTECYGGNRYSELGVRYLIRRRKDLNELPPSRSSDWIFIGIPNSKTDMGKDTASKAIEKFCNAGPENLARTIGHSSTAIPAFAEEFKGYVIEAQGLSEADDPHPDCSAGVREYKKTCTVALHATFHRARSPGRDDFSSGGALRFACGDWKIQIPPQ